MSVARAFRGHRGPLSSKYSHIGPAGHHSILDILDPAVIYNSSDGVLNYDFLVDKTVTVGCGPWKSPEPKDNVAIFIDGAIVPSRQSGAVNGFAVVDVDGVSFSGPFVPPSDPNALPGSGRYLLDGRRFVTYVVMLQNGNQHSSVSTEVLVKCNKPGGNIVVPAGSTNTNLKAVTIKVNNDDNGQLTSLDLTFDGYLHPFEGDVITVRIGGINFPLRAIDIPGLPSYTFTLTAADLRAKGLVGGSDIDVTWSVTDIGRNFSGYAPYALASFWLDPPSAIEAAALLYLNHDPVTPPSALMGSQAAGTGILAIPVIDLDRVKADEQMLLRVARYDGYKDGGTVEAFIEIIPIDGVAHTESLGKKDWGAIPPSELLFDVGAPLIFASQGATLRYWYTNAMKDTSESRRCLIGIEPEIVLEAPIAKGENLGVLDPDAIVGNYLEVEIPYSDEYFLPRASIVATLSGITNAGEQRTWTSTGQLPSNPSPGESEWIDFPKAHLNDMARVELSYTIKASGMGRIGQSLRKNLIVGKVGAPGELPPPIIDDLVDGVLPLPAPVMRVQVPASAKSVKGAVVTLLLNPRPDREYSYEIDEDLTAVNFSVRNYADDHDGEQVFAYYTIDVPLPDGSTASFTSTAVEFYIGNKERFGVPRVPQAENNTLDPIEVTTEVTVHPAADANLVASDSWWVIVMDENDLPTYTSAAVTGNVDAINVPVSAFATRIGKKAYVRYVVRRDSRDVSSAILVLDIKELPSVGDPGDGKLSRVIPEHESAERTLPILPLGDNQVENYTIADWPWIAIGQYYKVTCKAKPKGGSSYTTIYDPPATAVTAADIRDGIRGTIPHASLLLLSVDADFRIELQVNYAGGSDMSRAHAQQTTELTVVEAMQALPMPTINDITDSTLAPASLTNPSYVNSQAHEEIKADRYCWASIVSENGLNLPIVDRHRITTTEQTSGLHMSFDPADLKNPSDFPPGSTVKLLVTVNRKGGDTPYPPGDMVTFSERPYEIDSTASEWDFEWGFENAPSKGPAGPNGIIPGPYGIYFTFVSARLLPAQNTMAIEEFDHSGPGYGGDVFRMGAPENSPLDNVFRISFSRGREKVQFVLTSVHNNVEITWYTGAVAIGPPTVVPGNDPEKGHLVTSPQPPAGTKISSVEIHATDVIRMDSLKIKD